MNSTEEAQLLQTVEMFEVITRSQPQDVQSLEILKEAYAKLGRAVELGSTSRRLAEGHVLQGQVSSAILEYESILQRFPNDAAAASALTELRKSADASIAALRSVNTVERSPTHGSGSSNDRAVPADADDGRQALHRIFVGGRLISIAEFDACWSSPDLSNTPTPIAEPFVQVLSGRGYMSLERALHIISDKARIGFVPLERYDIESELARSFPKEILLRWCVLPFDRLSSATLVATSNPFNQRAAMELAQHTKERLLWYLSPPEEIQKALRRVFR